MFKVRKVNYSDTNRFSKTVIDYLSEDKKMKSFYKYPVALESFKKIIEDKQSDQTDRFVLTEVLQKQYENVNYNITEIEKQIALLKNKKTFTVTTAHQINLFTGPLYVIFKIVSCINLAKTLNQQYPQHHFVPIFWMGSEDHDFDEVNHLNLFNKKVAWQSNQKGATGKMRLTGINKTIAEVEQILGNSPEAVYLTKQLKQSFQEEKTFSEASFNFLHALFGQYGLVILQADNHQLKQLFAKDMEQELLEQSIYKLTNKTIDQFGETYKVQAKPREINLFYLKEDLRERIVKNETTQQYEILNTDLKFSKEDLIAELKNHPERFSPNVLMRPLYQEKILPNLAYIGGGGELAYWLELKETFEHFKINFPMLILRNSALLVDKKTNAKWQNTGFSFKQLFEPFDALSKTFIHQNNAIKIDFSEQIEQLQNIKNTIEKEALEIDQNLKQPIEGEFAKMQKSLQNIEQKMIRAAKRKSSEPLNQIQHIQQKLFPNDGLTERHDNFMSYYLKWGDTFFNLLFEHFDCLEKQFLIFIEE